MWLTYLGVFGALSMGMAAVICWPVRRRSGPAEYPPRLKLYKRHDTKDIRDLRGQSRGRDCEPLRG